MDNIVLRTCQLCEMKEICIRVELSIFGVKQEESAISLSNQDGGTRLRGIVTWKALSRAMWSL